MSCLHSKLNLSVVPDCTSFLFPTHQLERLECVPEIKYPLWGFFLGTKPDRSKTGGKKGLKIIEDPNYRRYGSTVDMDSALETFVPHRSDSGRNLTLMRHESVA